MNKNHTPTQGVGRSVAEIEHHVGWFQQSVVYIDETTDK